MATPLTVDTVSFNDTQQSDTVSVMVKNPLNNDHNTKKNNPFDGEDITLSDNSNSNTNSHSQHTTTNNTNQSSESITHSHDITRSPILDGDSKSNTELSIDPDDDDDDDSASDRINDDIINEIIADNANANANTNTNTNTNANDSNTVSRPNTVHHEVSRAYRKLLVHESQRLKAENGRLLRKVEQMRCMRTSMQSIYDQLQENDEQLQCIEQKEEEKVEEGQEEEPLEIEHVSDSQHLGRIRQNSEKQFLLKQKQREERKKLRQQRLQRFAQSRLQQQQIHNYNTAQIQNTNHGMPHLAPFIPRICSTPACNHPVRPGGRAICCRLCLTKQHTPMCTQRALKIIEKRRHTVCGNDIEVNIDRALPHYLYKYKYNQYNHNHRHHHVPMNTSLSVDNVMNNGNGNGNGIRRSRSHSTSHVLGVYNASHRHHKASHRSRERRSHSVKYLFCDKCRSKFNCLSDLEQHKIIAHSPVVAARMHSHSPTRNRRMPPPIPELTSSFHTTMPNQTTNTFRYKPRTNNDQVLAENVESYRDSINRNKKLVRLGFLPRRMRSNEHKNDDNDNNSRGHQVQRKRKHSLSQLFSTFLPNSRRNVDVDVDINRMDEEKEEKEDNSNKRRTLSSLLYHRRSRDNNNNNNNTPNRSDKIRNIDTPNLSDNAEDIVSERNKIKELRRKLSLRKQNFLFENREEKMDSNRENGINGDRARHRRSNAINIRNIAPFITNSDADDHDHDEEEKSLQPIPHDPNNNEYSDLELAALRRKARERKLRKNNTIFSASQHHHPYNHNPFRSHRSSFRSSSSMHHPPHTQHHVHPHRRSSHAQHHRYKRGHNHSQNNHNHRPRLRQPFIAPSDDRDRIRLRRSTDSDNASTSSSLYVSGHRDEEIARLLQERDSLLQHFNDTISRHNVHDSNPNANTSGSFDSNALRQRGRSQTHVQTQRRNANNRNNNSNDILSAALRHRQSESAPNVSHFGLNRVDLTYLPIRCIEESDLYSARSEGSEFTLNCSICQEKFKCGDKVKTLPCFHFFHVDEIDRWLTHSRHCPVCRHSIDHINFK